MMSELTRQTALLDDSHRLHRFGRPFCVLGLSTFEMVIELAAAENAPVSEILMDHWRTSADYEPSTPMADSLGGRAVDESTTFAAGFLGLDF